MRHVAGDLSWEPYSFDAGRPAAGRLWRRDRMVDHDWMMSD